MFDTSFHLVLFLYYSILETIISNLLKWIAGKVSSCRLRLTFCKIFILDRQEDHCRILISVRSESGSDS